MVITTNFVVPSLVKLFINLIHIQMKVKLLLLALFVSSFSWGQTILFSENMGTPSGTTLIGANIFENGTPIVFSGSGDVRTSTASTGYAGASGSGNVFITNTVGIYFEISGIDTSSYLSSQLALSLGHFKSTIAGNNELAIEVSSDGITYSALSYSRATGTGTANWVLINPTGTIPSTTNLRIRFTQTSATSQFRIDDVKVIATLPPSVTLSTNTPQVTAANVLQGTNDHVLSSFKVDVINSTATLTGVAFATSGTYQASDINGSSFKLWYNTTNIFGTATQVGTGLPSTSSGSGDILIFSSLSRTIPVGTGYFWVTTSFSATATGGRTINIDAILNADLTFSSGTKSGSAIVAGTQTIILTTPNTPDTFTEGCTTNTSQVLNWTAPLTGTFDGYILVVREAATPHAITTIVAATQTFNLNYASAPTYNATTSRVLYIGTGTTATVTGLTQGVNYTFALYTYKNNGSTSLYCATSTTTSQTITMPNVVSATSVPGNTTGSISWANPTVGCYNQILVVITSASGISFVPTGSDASAYSANVVFSGFNQVVYYNSSNNVNITGLTNGVTYYLEIFVRNGSEWSSGVEVSVTPDINVPTVLNTGDMLLIAYDNTTGASADDSIRLLTMVPINTGTKFLWSNTTYETGGNPAANSRTDKWFTCVTPAPTGNVPYLEFEYTGTTPIPAGSVFCIRTVATGTSSTITAVSPSGTSFTSFNIIGKTADGSTLVNHNSVNVSVSSPDSMFLMQGFFTYSTTGSTFTGNVLSAIQDGGLWYDLSDNLTSISGDNLRRSRKHPQLNCASIQANSSPAAYEVSYNVSSSTYTTGNRPYLLGSILNYGANWISSYASCPSPSPFVITPSDNFNAWTGSANSNWFDCNNWSLLTVPNSESDVVINASALNDAIINFSAAFSDLYLDIAKAKNLTINGKKVQVEATTNNILEVYGDLSISGTGVLDMDDSNAATADGVLKLYGDWTNSLTIDAFEEGNGTVEFLGSSPQIINNVAPIGTERFYNVKLDNDFDTSVSNDLIATGDLNVTTGNVISIDTNGFIYAYNKLTNNGTFTIENNGQLIQVNETDTNDGDYGDDALNTKFTVKRTAFANKDDYVYWSAPVVDFAVTNIPNGPRYLWNTTFSNSNGTVGNWNAYSGDMNTAVGYIVRVPNSMNARPLPSQPLTIEFKGKSNNGTKTYAISRGIDATSLDDNWNLIGNPYPSAISADEFLDVNADDLSLTTALTGSIWVWKHGQSPSNSVDPFYYNFENNYFSNDYIEYNSSGSTEPTFNGKIASGQGFMVNMKESAGIMFSPTEYRTDISFTNAMRLNAGFEPYDNSEFFRSSNSTSTTVTPIRHRIWLDIINTSNYQSETTLVAYCQGATLANDNRYDTFFVPKSEVGFYSLIASNPFIIQGRPLPFLDSDLVPMGVKIVNAGSHKIAIKKVDGLFEGNQGIYLEDTVLGIVHDLKAAPYTFTSEVGVFNSRFIVRYTPSALSNDDFDSLDNNVVVSTQSTDVSIKSANELMSSVIVYDILGRELVRKNNINANDITLSNVSAVNQALIVKITLENGQVVTRKIIL